MSATTNGKFSEIGARIRAARQARGLSQERFAPLVGVTRRHLIRLENGEHHPSLPLRERLAAHTDEAASHFALDEDDEEADPAMREAFQLYVELHRQIASRGRVEP